ncbi:MAG: HAD-IB family phosphatase [Chloroflexota bacterium]|jgi:phosphoserine phosphatase
MRWPHYDHIIFDCDSTLTTIEGIDVLAESVGKKWRVEVLTRAAMDGELDLEEVYAKRLRAVRPTRGQIQAIRRRYKQNIVEDAATVIATLQMLGHQVYIISGGLAEPVEEFGVYLGVPRANIRAVDVRYNELSGKWWQRQEHYPVSDEHYLSFAEGALTVSDGKAEIVQQLVGGKNGRSLLIGDGSSDLLAGRAVDLFVGYGGVTARRRVLAEAPAFIHSPSLAPLLALAAGPAVLARWQAGQSVSPLVQKSIQLIKTGAITFTDERLKEKFQQAFHSKISTAY